MSWKDLPGWFDYEAVYDRAFANCANFETVVEIGVGFGRSLAYLAGLAIADTKKLRIFGVDPFYDDWDSDKPTWGANHAEWARQLGGPFNAVTSAMHERAPRELEYVNLLRLRSLQAARLFKPGELAFVFIDGSHHYEDVAADLEAWEPLVRKGGIFAGHDHTDSFPGVQRAVGERWSDGKAEQVGACWVRSVT